MKYIKPPFLSTSFSDGKEGMKKRIENILDTKGKKTGFVILAIALVLVIGVGAFVAISSKEPQNVIGDEPAEMEDAKISQLITAICSSPVTSSNPGAYITEHKAEFDELVALDTDALKYMFTEFEKGNQTGLNGHIMMTACNKILGKEDIKLEAENGQKWYDAYKKHINEELNRNDEKFIKDNFPKASIILDIQKVNYARLHPVKIEDAIKYAILDSNKGGYLDGECAGEGHILLDTENVTVKYNAKAGTEYIEAYVLAMYGEYGFQNGIFTKVSASGIIPTRITFSRNEVGEYTLTEYKEAMDGNLYAKSIREMFPKELWNRAISHTDKDGEECKTQEKAYAEAYLKSINREAEINQKVDRILANMNVTASNDLMDFFYEYPYWLGTEENIENGIRYVYEKLWEDKGNGDGIVTFKKYEYDTKKVTDETVIEIKGSELNYIKGEKRFGKKGIIPKLTLDIVCDLAKEKGKKLTWSDFEQYPSTEIGFGLYILDYEIDESYKLMIGGAPNEEPMYLRLVSKKDDTQYIDIRNENIEEFLARTKGEGSL